LQFAATYAEGFRYIAEWNCWMLWNGTYWKQEKTLQAFDKARVLCRQAEDAKAKIVAAVVTLARADRAIAATEDQWNTKLFALNTPAEEKDQ
jgi:putative DNA primase/helicase